MIGGRSNYSTKLQMRNSSSDRTSSNTTTSTQSLSSPSNSRSHPTVQTSPTSQVIRRIQEKACLPTDQLPLRLQAVLENYSHLLASYEFEEIKLFNSIYCLGNYEAKQERLTKMSQEGSQSERIDSASSSSSHIAVEGALSFDDERGDYCLLMEDHIAYRYLVLESLGRGSFGQVVKAFDYKTKRNVAIKIIRNKKRFYNQALIELKVLRALKEWDPEDNCNCVRVFDSFMFRKHLCLVFELLSINLYEFIKSNDFKGFSIGLIRRFTSQILMSLCLLYEKKIIHCDLKPENILLQHPTKSHIKVIDFGSSCFDSEKVYTYIQSRFYRSPEVILGIPYNMAIDMWSLGCIMVELYTGYPIFPGENEQEQILCMMEILGIPNSYIIEKSPRKDLFFEKNNIPKIYTNSKGKKRRPNSRSLYGCLKSPMDRLFVDFIQRCFDWDPEKRMTPVEALRHPWICHAGARVPSLTTLTLNTTKSPTSNPTSLNPSIGLVKKIELRRKERFPTAEVNHLPNSISTNPTAMHGNVLANERQDHLPTRKWSGNITHTDTTLAENLHRSSKATVLRTGAVALPPLSGNAAGVDGFQNSLHRSKHSFTTDQQGSSLGTRFNNIREEGLYSSGTTIQKMSVRAPRTTESFPLPTSIHQPALRVQPSNYRKTSMESEADNIFKHPTKVSSISSRVKQTLLDTESGGMELGGQAILFKNSNPATYSSSFHRTRPKTSSVATTKVGYGMEASVEDSGIIPTGLEKSMNPSYRKTMSRKHFEAPTRVFK